METNVADLEDPTGSSYDLHHFLSFQSLHGKEEPYFAYF